MKVRLSIISDARIGRSVFGLSEFAMRSLSALCAAISIPVFYLVARRVLVDKAAEALAMAIFAVTVLQVWYAKEARCYSLLVFAR